MAISGQHIVITGGTSGIGLALVEKLQGQNDLTIIARPSPRLDELQARFPHINTVECDLADRKAVEGAAKSIATLGKPVDALINNAAVQHTPHFTHADFRPDGIAEEIDINFTAPCLLINGLLPALAMSQRAMILNINSGLAIAPKTGSAIYCATKGALDLLTRSLGYQLEGTGIAVGQVFLPLVETGMTAGRGSGKITASAAANAIINALTNRRATTDVGKVRLLRTINRVSPVLAAKIMKRG